MPSDGEAILNALPNPVLLVAPDGKIVDANMAAELFFEISAQFLQRQCLAQQTSIFRKLTVEQNIRAILETLGLSRKEARKNAWSSFWRSWESGQVAPQLRLHPFRRRATPKEIARAMVTRPRFLLLDEPFSGVDPKAVEELQTIIEQLRRGGIGILITDHFVRETLTVTDRSYVISQGQVLTSGSASDLVNHPIVRQVYLGERFYMHLDDEQISAPAPPDFEREAEETAKKG